MMKSHTSRPLLGIFDFDGTLIKGDSFIRFGIYSVGLTRFILAIIKSSLWILRWKSGMISSSIAKEKLFLSLYKGMPYGHFIKKGEEFADTINENLKEDVFEAMAKMIEDGGLVIIATASMEEWIKPWADRNNVSTVIGTKVQVDGNSRLTGKFSTPNCRGQEKVRRIVEYLSSLETDETPDAGILGKYRVSSWGNLPEDRAILEIADYPHVVD